jgi:hypothetical protein
LTLLERLAWERLKRLRGYPIRALLMRLKSCGERLLEAVRDCRTKNP